MNATIERLMEMPREMGIAQAAYVLGRSEDHIARAIAAGRIEAQADEGRGSGAKRRNITITRESLLIYIVRSTTGDKLTLMRSIKQRMPANLVALAQLVAAPQPLSDATAAPAPQTQRRPRNIIPHPALADHPEFDFASRLKTGA
ncbi:hypothetical protein [Prosthecobacter vanneervenii]|uniref:Uncharacterized protein n=1 Tax=Prosthecobacter vanneervenii TaxID=48466 RepID=A0A7W7YBJ5_9BACT|nr:hypothetical protein [Prosthecobacter vanneervenii]MBB5033148.1 hypothetical protein [Prosthecobacter vanneervenii]